MTTIKINGQDRKARFNMRTLRLFTEAQAARGEGSLRTVSDLIYFSLLADDPTLKFEDLEDALDESNIKAALEAAKAESEKFALALNPPQASEAQATTGNVN